MSRHDGVSCDSCLKSNFRGKRYKCLVCYDYDLCATCYEAGATTTRHTADHAVQCILTRSDFDIFYGGEALTGDQSQAFSCPYCIRMGFTEALLQEHVTAEHADMSSEVVCPICAAQPGGDPNHVTDDFVAHLTLEHRAPREFDEPTGIRHVRRIPHPGRGVGGARTRRATNMHFNSGGSALTGLAPSGRETMDPIAELLSQLSSVRSRAAAAQSVSSQLQQLEMQLQSTRQQLERLPRRQADVVKSTLPAPPSNTDTQSAAVGGGGWSSNVNSQFLLPRCVETVIEEDGGEVQRERSGRSLFVQELLLSTLTEQLQTHESALENFDNMSGKTPSSTVITEKPKSDAALGGGSGTDVAVTDSSGASKNSFETPTSVVPNTSSVGHKPVVEKLPGTKQKSSSASVGLQVGRSVGMGLSRGGRNSQSTGQFASQGDRHSQAIHVRQGAPLMQNVVDISNNLAMNVAVAGGAGYDTENPQPLPGRPGSGGRERDARLNPPTAKRNLVKHLPATKADREPPPH